MNTAQRRYVFNRRDLLIFGGLTILSAIPMVIVGLTRTALETAICGILPVGGLLIYACRLYSLWQRVCNVSYQTSQGLLVVLDGHEAPQAEVEAVAAKVLEAWGQFAGGYSVVADSLRGWWLFFERWPYVWRGERYNGLTFPSGSIHVAKDESQSVRDTALQHELAHVVFAKAVAPVLCPRDAWNEAKFLEIARRNELPC